MPNITTGMWCYHNKRRQYEQNAFVIFCTKFCFILQLIHVAHVIKIGLLLAYGIIVSLQGNDSPNSWNTQNISKYVVVLLKDEIRISKYINNTSLSHWKNNKCVKINVVKILSQACLNGYWVSIGLIFLKLNVVN